MEVENQEKNYAKIIIENNEPAGDVDMWDTWETEMAGEQNQKHDASRLNQPSEQHHNRHDEKGQRITVGQHNHRNSNVMKIHDRNIRHQRAGNYRGRPNRQTMCKHYEDVNQNRSHHSSTHEEYQHFDNKQERCGHEGVDKRTSFRSFVPNNSANHRPIRVGSPNRSNNYEGHTRRHKWGQSEYRQEIIVPNTNERHIPQIGNRNYEHERSYFDQHQSTERTEVRRISDHHGYQKSRSRSINRECHVPSKIFNMNERSRNGSPIRKSPTRYIRYDNNAELGSDYRHSTVDDRRPYTGYAELQSQSYRDSNEDVADSDAMARLQKVLTDYFVPTVSTNTKLDNVQRSRSRSPHESFKSGKRAMDRLNYCEPDDEEDGADDTDGDSDDCGVPEFDKYNYENQQYEYDPNITTDQNVLKAPLHCVKNISHNVSNETHSLSMPEHSLPRTATVNRQTNSINVQQNTQSRVQVSRHEKLAKIMRPELANKVLQLKEKNLQKQATSFVKNISGVKGRNYVKEGFENTMDNNVDDIIAEYDDIFTKKDAPQLPSMKKSMASSDEKAQREGRQYKSGTEEGPVGGKRGKRKSYRSKFCGWCGSSGHNYIANCPLYISNCHRKEGYNKSADSVILPEENIERNATYNTSPTRAEAEVATNSQGGISSTVSRSISSVNATYLGGVTTLSAPSIHDFNGGGGGSVIGNINVPIVPGAYSLVSTGNSAAPNNGSYVPSCYGTTAGLSSMLGNISAISNEEKGSADHIKPSSGKVFTPGAAVINLTTDFNLDQVYQEIDMQKGALDYLISLSKVLFGKLPPVITTKKIGDKHYQAEITVGNSRVKHSICAEASTSMKAKQSAAKQILRKLDVKLPPKDKNIIPEHPATTKEKNISVYFSPFNYLKKLSVTRWKRKPQCEWKGENTKGRKQAKIVVGDGSAEILTALAFGFGTTEEVKNDAASQILNKLGIDLDLMQFHLSKKIKSKKSEIRCEEDISLDASPWRYLIELSRARWGEIPVCKREFKAQFPTEIQHEVELTVGNGSTVIVSAIGSGSSFAVARGNAANEVLNKLGINLSASKQKRKEIQREEDRRVKNCWNYLVDLSKLQWGVNPIFDQVNFASDSPTQMQYNVQVSIQNKSSVIFKDIGFGRNIENAKIDAANKILRSMGICLPDLLGRNRNSQQNRLQKIFKKNPWNYLLDLSKLCWGVEPLLSRKCEHKSDAPPELRYNVEAVLQVNNSVIARAIGFGSSPDKAKFEAACKILKSLNVDFDTVQEKSENVATSTSANISGSVIESTTAA